MQAQVKVNIYAGLEVVGLPMAVAQIWRRVFGCPAGSCLPFRDEVWRIVRLICRVVDMTQAACHSLPWWGTGIGGTNCPIMSACLEQGRQVLR